MLTYALAAAMVACVLIAVLKRKITARHVAERLRNARMIRHANEEHALVLKGSVAGVYGDHLPSPELRGVGLWM